MISRLLRIFGGLIIFLLLTLLTQVGGLIYLLAYVVSLRLRARFHSPAQEYFLFPALFLSFYLVAVVVIIPPLARQFGREPLPWRGEVRPLTILTCLLNRHYVVPPLKQLLLRSAQNITEEYPQAKVNYLDANFPFLDKFPLWPHLSHSDGKKLDIAFFYTDKSGSFVGDAPSPIGYGVFEGPRAQEVNYPERCQQEGYWQYGILEKFIPPTDRTSYQFSESATRGFILTLVNDPVTEKLFIEPHLKDRMNLRSPKIRFHGCQAVRHDDHIHVQVN
jgi:hypothetical protein